MLPATVREAAQRFGERTAYVAEDGETLTYRDLDRTSDATAAHLHRHGVRSGDVVALVLEPGLPYVVAYAALAKLGAITAGVNPRLSDRERQAVLQRAEPRLVLAAPGEEPAGCETVTFAHHSQLADAGGVPPELPDDPDRDVAIIFTSGTTGAPKGARYGNRQLEFITRTDVGETWGAGGRMFSGTSFAHLGFMTKVVGNIQRGATSFIMARWSPSRCLDLIARERLNTVAGVPTQLALMLALEDFDDRDLSHVEYVIAGGGPVTPGLAEEVRRRFAAKLATRYSCTEAGIGLGTAFDDPDEDAIVSVGRPHAAVAMTLRDPDAPDDPDAVPLGGIGEVCLRSPACMRGYWRDDAATAAAFTSDGYVRTGDLGHLDDRGRLHLVGRAKEMYVRGGYNVYPVEVEGVLSTHPALDAVAVVPVADPVMGEIGVACVVVRHDATPPDLESLRAHGRESLAAYKLPERLEILDALPLTPGEKLDRRALADKVTSTSVGREPHRPMDLDFTAEQEALRASIRAVLAKECPMTFVRDVMERRARPDALWATVCELGWPALTIAEEHGGIGLGPIELGVLAEELGRVVAPGALLPTLSQFVAVVQECGDEGDQARWLPGVAAGTARATLAIAEPDAGYALAATHATAVRDGDSLRLSGTKRYVFEATEADEIAVTVRLDDAVRVVVVPRGSVRTSEVRSIDETRVFATVDLDGAVVAADRLLARSDETTIGRALEVATVALALETVGACQSIFDVALEYAKQREQFGVPIGSFQAIKHKFADLAIALERARATCYFATLCIAEDDDRRHVAVAAAKAAAGDAQQRFGKEGIQILGGIGFTWEHDMHIYVKRAKCDELCFGTAGAQRARIAELLGV